MTKWAIGPLFVHAACSRQSAPPPTQRPTPRAVVAELDASTAIAEAAPSPLVDASSACDHPRYQPNTCMMQDGELDEAAVVQWFAGRGVQVKSDKLGIEIRCHEVAFGPEAAPTLVCTEARIAVGPYGADASPIMQVMNVRVLDVRDHQAFERVRLPLALSEAGNWGGDTLFAARYAVDAARGAIHLEASAADCEAGRRGVVEYHQSWIDSMAAQPSMPAETLRLQRNVRATQARLDAAWVQATCRAAGEYVPTRGGRLTRAQP